MAAPFTHLFTSRWHLERAFPPSALAAIAREIAAAERRHGGEIRFAIESCFHVRWLMAGLTAHERAKRVFADLGVWDTEHNSGVLIYVLLAERHIEIIADRGYRGRVGEEEWAVICAGMREEFRRGEFEMGAVSGIRQVAQVIGRHFPRQEHDRNELPDSPVILR
jgi:uncharacterized membrane protein